MQEVVEIRPQAATYTVGPGQTYGDFSALPALQPGDVVQVTWRSTPYAPVMFTRSGTASQPITIQGIPVNGNRPVISGGVNTVQFELSNWMVFQGFDVTGGSSRCVYHHAANITIRDTVVHNCPAHGILGADTESGSLTLERVEVHHCGLGDQKHQIYMATDENMFPGSVFRMQYCYLHDANGGHGVKSRAERNEIYYNWIEGSYFQELELIGSAEAVEGLKREDSDVVGNVIRKAGMNTGGTHTVRIGGDGTGQSWGRYRFVNNTFILRADSTAVFNLFDGSDTLEAHNNAFYRDGGGAVDLIRNLDAATPLPTVLGTHNWAPTGTAEPAGWSGTTFGSAPGFTNYAGFDLHPVAGSPLVDTGQANPPTIPAKPFPSPLGVPAFEPPARSASQGAARSGPQPIDIGAYERGGVGCPIVGHSWLNTPITPASGVFTVQFDVTPTASPTDAVVGLSAGSISDYAGFSVNVRFNNTGHIDARDGATYPTSTILFSANTSYHFRLVVDSSTMVHTYSAYVTAAGGTEQTIGTGYHFRTVADTLNNWAAFVDPAGAGTITVCNFSVSGGGGGGGGGDPSGDPTNKLPQGSFETSLGGNGDPSKDYFLIPSAGQTIASSTSNPIAGSASLHLTLTNQNYSEWHDRTASDLTITGTLTAEGTIRNNGASPITVKLSVGYSDSTWAFHMNNTDYTLQPGVATAVAGTAAINGSAGNTQLAHWIKCTTPAGCDVSWDKAYIGFTPPP